MVAREAFEKPWRQSEGGALSLDFANTVDWRLRESPVELLRSPADLLRWARAAGILDAEEARELHSRQEAHPRVARRVLSEAVEVRTAITEIFQAVARGEEAPVRALTRLEAAARRAWTARALRPAPGGAEWGWRKLDPDRPALAAALDAARLLTSPERERVRECADAECGWFFLDTSRNRSRRWCNMQGCGNRNKARRWYRRRRAGKAEPSGVDSPERLD